MKDKLEDIITENPQSNPKNEKVLEKIKPLFPHKLRVIYAIPKLLENDMRKKGQTTRTNNKSINRADSQEDTKFQVSSDRLLLKAYKLPKAISLEHHDILRYGEKIVNEEIKKDWCKIARKIKYSPTLSLGRCHINYRGIPDKFIIKFAKAFSCVISLDLARSVIDKKQIDKYCLFFSNLARLKNLAYLGENDINISAKLEDLREFFQKICNTIIIRNVSSFTIADYTKNGKMARVYMELEENNPLKEFKIYKISEPGYIKLNYTYQEIKQKVSTQKTYNISCGSFVLLTQYETKNSAPPKSHPLKRPSVLDYLRDSIQSHGEDLYRSYKKQGWNYVFPQINFFILLSCLKIIPSGEPISLKIITTKCFQTDQPDAFSKLWGAIRKVPNLLAIELSLPELSEHSISDLLETLVAIKTLKKVRVSAKNYCLAKPSISLDDDADLLKDTVMENLTSFSNSLALDQDVKLNVITKKPLFTLEPIIKDIVKHRDNNIYGLSHAIANQTIKQASFIFSSERVYSFNKKANETGSIQSKDSKILWPNQEQTIFELCINYQTVKFSTLFVVEEEEKRVKILESIQRSIKSVEHEIELMENNGKLTGIITVSSNKHFEGQSFESLFDYAKFIIL